MSSSTVSARQAQTRDHRVAVALHELADLFATGHVPESTFDDQAVAINVHVPSADTVVGFAARMGTKVVTDDGYLPHTLTKVALGIGSDPGCPWSEAYAAAVVLTVMHVPDAPEVDVEPEPAASFVSSVRTVSIGHGMSRVYAADDIAGLTPLRVLDGTGAVSTTPYLGAGPWEVVA